MTAARLWSGLGANVVLAVLALALLPAPPREGWPPATAATVGAAAGVALFVALERRRPHTPTNVLLALTLLVAAAAEEVLWRRTALGELDGRGPALVALAVSTVGFCLVHRRRRRTHVLTGAVFGLLYLVGGGLVASCCAHGAYNVAVVGVRSPGTAAR